MDKSFPRRTSIGKREFSEEEIKDLRIAFDLCDRNRDGQITISELNFMFDKLGIDLPNEKIQEIIKTASHEGNELLNESEFMIWVTKIQNLLPNEDDASEDLLAAFRVFDVEQKGYITIKELRIAMEILGETVTEEQLTEFIKLATTDAQGRINYEEFAKQFS